MSEPVHVDALRKLAEWWAGDSNDLTGTEKSDEPEKCPTCSGRGYEIDDPWGMPCPDCTLPDQHAKESWQAGIEARVDETERRIKNMGCAVSILNDSYGKRLVSLEKDAPLIPTNVKAITQLYNRADGADKRLSTLESTLKAVLLTVPCAKCGTPSTVSGRGRCWCEKHGDKEVKVNAANGPAVLNEADSGGNCACGGKQGICSNYKEEFDGRCGNCNHNWRCHGYSEKPAPLPDEDGEVWTGGGQYDFPATPGDVRVVDPDRPPCHICGEVPSLRSCSRCRTLPPGDFDLEEDVRNCGGFIRNHPGDFAFPKPTPLKKVARAKYGRLPPEVWALAGAARHIANHSCWDADAGLWETTNVDALKDAIAKFDAIHKREGSQ